MKIVALALASAGMLFIGCEKKQEPSNAGTAQAPKTMSDKASDAGKAVGDTISATADKAKEAVAAGADKLKEAFISSTQSSLDSVKAQIKSLSDKASTASIENKIGIEAAVKSLREMLTGVETKLGELKAATGEWEKIKADVTTALDALKKAAGDAVAKFGK